jgi:hypothetical protein
MKQHIAKAALNFFAVLIIGECVMVAISYF